MTDYVKLTDYAAKDALLSGNPSKVVKGTELGAEFDAIATAVSTKLDATVINAATSKTTPVDADELPITDSAASYALKKLTWANLKATIKTYYDSVTSTLTNKTVNLTSNTLTGTTAQFNTALSDGDFTTLAGTETLTNKTLTAPVLTNPTVTASSGTAMKITNTGTGDSFVVEDSASTDTTPFVIDASGNVIVGHTARIVSTNALEAHSTAAVNGTPGIASFNWDALSNVAPSFGLYKSQSDTIGTQGIVSSGVAETIAFWFDDGTQFVRGAQISGAVDGTPGTNDMPGRLMFLTTADGASTPTERMRINNSGEVSVGGTGVTGRSFLVQKNTTGATTAGAIAASSIVMSDVTTDARFFSTNALTEAAVFTLGALNHYIAIQSTIGAGSTVTNQYGFHANSTLTGATNNYGFYSNLTSGTGRWNFYAVGTAANAFSGDVKIFGAGALGYDTGSGGTVTQAISRTTGVTLNKTNGAITLFSAAGTATWQSFTVTNSTVAATDTIIVNQKSGTDLYILSVTAVSAGSFRISFATTGGTTTEQPVFNFAVIKAVTA